MCFKFEGEGDYKNNTYGIIFLYINEIEIKTTDVHKVAWVGNSHFASSSVVDKYVNLWHTNQTFVPVGTLRSNKKKQPFNLRCSTTFPL